MSINNLTPSGLRTICLILLISACGWANHSSGQTADDIPVKVTKCSEYKADTPITEILAADALRIFAGTADGSIQAVELSLSASLWRTELGGEIASNLAVSDAAVVVVSNASNAEAAPAESVLRSMSKATGVTNWTVRLSFSEHLFLDATGGNLTAVSSDGRAMGIEPQSGRIIWRARSFGKLSAHPFISQTAVAIGTSDKQVIIIARDTGAVLFKYSTDFAPTAVFLRSDDNFVVGDERGNVALVGMPSGKIIWKFKSGAAVSFVSVKDDGLYVTSLDNFIYRISLYNGDVIWKRRLPGRIVDGSLVLDGFVATLINGENSLFIIDQKTGKILDQFSSPGKNFINRVPINGGNSKLVLADSEGIGLYGLAGCGKKAEKAVSAPPSKIS